VTTLGYHHTAEAKAAIASARRGQTLTPESRAKITGRPKSTAPKYFARHRRVEAARGLAKTHTCVDGDHPASEWAFRHDGDPLNVFDYDPRCRPCHRKYDRDSYRRKK
jgi:hypothetical protein